MAALAALAGSLLPLACLLLLACAAACGKTSMAAAVASCLHR
jgi:hypothetical protein